MSSHSPFSRLEPWRPDSPYRDRLPRPKATGRLGPVITVRGRIWRFDYPGLVRVNPPVGRA